MELALVEDSNGKKWIMGEDRFKLNNKHSPVHFTNHIYYFLAFIG